jgi:hypothetical protein
MGDEVQAEVRSQSSVEVNINAKGEVAVKAKVYVGGVDGIDTVDAAVDKAVESAVDARTKAIARVR